MKKLLILLTSFISLFLCAQYTFAASKYSREFIQHFALCRPFSESKYNTAYNSRDTYEIKGYTPDGTGKCIYVETNSWQRATYVTTCRFLPPQHEEYFNAMLNPDVKTSVLIKGMAFVDANEKAVYLKYYNNPAVCTTEMK